MICFPNAKINIGLFVTEKRTDGYHNIESIFFPVPIKDALEVLPASDASSMQIYGLSISGDQTQNLVWKAWELLKKDFPNRIGNIDIKLLKNIPMGAGMGGGSSDGSFMLNLLNDYFSLDLTKNEIADYALRLGSDCPFFVENKASFAQGRGERLSEIDLDLSAYSLQIICPKVHITTAEAFGRIQAQSASFDLKNINALPISKWKALIKNDFEPSVFSAHPELALIKEQLYQQSAIYASMSGTGSTIYGFFEKGKKAEVMSSIDFSQFYFE